MRRARSEALLLHSRRGAPGGRGLGSGGGGRRSGRVRGSMSSILRRALTTAVSASKDVSGFVRVIIAHWPIGLSFFAIVFFFLRALPYFCLLLFWLLPCLLLFWLLPCLLLLYINP